MARFYIVESLDPTLLGTYQALDLIGVVLNGAIGATIARHRGFDAVGFAVLAIVSSLGGGLLRDTILQVGVPAAFADPTYLWAALGGGLIAYVLHLTGRAWDIVYPNADAIVLGVWSVTGSMKALQHDLPWPSAILLGVLTAVGGGMIRDIITGEVPAIFGGNTLYATAALLGASLNTLFWSLDQVAVGMIVAATSAAVLCMVAHWRQWRLPGNHNWAPVGMSAAALARLLNSAERRGRRGRKRTAGEEPSGGEVI